MGWVEKGWDGGPPERLVWEEWKGRGRFPRFPSPVLDRRTEGSETGRRGGGLKPRNEGIRSVMQPGRLTPLPDNESTTMHD